MRDVSWNLMYYVKLSIIPEYLENINQNLRFVIPFIKLKIICSIPA